MLAARGQVRAIAIRQREFGLSNRDQALGYVAAVVGHPVASRKDLSAREASAVLDRLDEQLGTEEHR